MDLLADRPLLILSGNSIEHLLIALAALHAGVPHCPVLLAYSQPSSDLATLRYVMELLTPGLVAAFEGHRFERAIAATVPESTPLVSDVTQLAGRECLHLDRLHGDSALADAPNAAIDWRHHREIHVDVWLDRASQNCHHDASHALQLPVDAA